MVENYIKHLSHKYNYNPWVTTELNILTNTS